MEIKRKLSDSNCFLENQRKKANFLIETDFTNCISVPRLESIAIVQVVTDLCKRCDVRATMIEELYVPYEVKNSGSFINSSLTVKNILKKVSLLPLPNLTKVEMSLLVTPIVIQIFKWLDYINIHIEYYNLDRIRYSSLNFLCWNSQGILDRAQTLKQLVIANYDSDLFKLKKFSRHIYELACTLCVEDIIPNLWEKLAKKSKVHYLNDGLNDNVDKHLIAYWSLVNNNELSKLPSKIGPYFYIYNWEHSISQNMFSLALFKGNLVAVKYFWDKLTAEEIICNLEQWVYVAVENLNDEIEQDCYYLDTDEYADVLFFLLSKVSVETQREVIRKYNHVILQSLLLFWPYQRFLLPTIRTMWDSLDGEVYIKLLYTVAKHASKDKMSLTLLKELCCMSPINLKRFFILDYLTGNNFCDARFVLHTLVSMEDIRTCKEMIRYANVEEKIQIAEEIILALLLLNYKIMDADKLNVIDKFFQEISLSESDILSIKEKIILIFGRKLYSLFKVNKRKCKRFIYTNWKIVKKFSNWAFTSKSKLIILNRK